MLPPISSSAGVMPWPSCASRGETARTNAKIRTMTVGDSIALVIGASSGMGRATAVQFAREGAKVVAVARRRDRLEELQAQAGVGFEVADATDPDAMQRVADHTIQRFGRSDILVYPTGTNT